MVFNSKATVKLFPEAKLNLVLRVGPIREDGYHQISSLMVRVPLRDELVVSPSPLAGLSLTVRGAELDPYQTTLHLAWQAAKEKLSGDQLPIGARAVLHKRIPLASGLGGAASDGAEFLNWLLGVSGARLSKEEVFKLGFMVGADLPFFLSGYQSALVGGAGEEVEPCQVELPEHLLLVVPRLDKSTGDLYRRLDDLELTRESGGVIGELPTLPRRDDGLLENDFIPLWEERLEPMLGELSSFAREKEGLCGMSGSGPSLFAFHPERERLVELARSLILAAGGTPLRIYFFSSAGAGTSSGEPK